MNINQIWNDRIEIILRFVSLISVLMFLYFFFKTMIPLMTLQCQLKQENTISKLILSLEPSTSNILISIVVFSAVVVITLFGSSLFLRLGDNEIKINKIPELDFKHINPGNGGVNKIIDQNNTLEFVPKAINELATDGILSEVCDDNKLVGYITIESFLKGCTDGDCRNINIFNQSLPKKEVYSDNQDRVVLGEDILSVATKMYTNKSSALPVMDTDGRMVGSINYIKVLQLLVENMTSTTKQPLE